MWPNASGPEQVLERLQAMKDLLGAGGFVEQPADEGRLLWSELGPEDFNAETIRVGARPALSDLAHGMQIVCECGNRYTQRWVPERGYERWTIDVVG